LGLVRLPRKESLRFLHCLFEVLEGLLVGVDEELVVKGEFEVHAGDHAQVEGEVPMVAAHAVEDVDQLHPHFPDLDGPYHLLQLDLNRVYHLVLAEDCLEEPLSALLQQGVHVGLLLVELDAEEAAELLERLLLIGEHIVTIYLLHVIVLALHPPQNQLGVLLQMLAESTVVGALHDVD
jgi:hypothetical protein